METPDPSLSFHRPYRSISVAAGSIAQHRSTPDVVPNRIGSDHRPAGRGTRGCTTFSSRHAMPKLAKEQCSGSWTIPRSPSRSAYRAPHGGRDKGCGRPSHMLRLGAISHWSLQDLGSRTTMTVPWSGVVSRVQEQATDSWSSNLDGRVGHTRAPATMASSIRRGRSGIPITALASRSAILACARFDLGRTMSGAAVLPGQFGLRAIARPTAL